uniref:SP1-Sep-3 n=2 Tax=Sepia latimanus TaxID=3248881 RepID=R4G2N2_SEPLA
MLSAICCLLVLPLAWASFGVPNKQIVSGTNAKDCEFPHIAFVLIDTENGTFACGGSLIDSTHVVTAAHCVDSGVTSVDVFFGSLNKRNMPHRISVSSLTIHGDYDGDNDITVLNDVAVLTLSKAMKFSECIKPIELAKAGDRFVGNCHIAGWGKTGEKMSSSVELLRATVPVLTKKQCSKYAGGLQTQHICAGQLTENGKTTCQGDSGGPLMCYRASDSKLVLAGIVSYGWTCTEGLSVFARVSHFNAWITRNS